MRSLLLLASFMLFLPLHSQNSESATLDGLIQTAISRNPENIDDSTRKEIISKMKKAWYNWLYTLNTTSVLSEYYDLLSDLDRIARFRYESGDIDFIQFSTSNNILAQIKTNQAIFENRSQQYKNTIFSLTLNETDIYPADTTVDIYEIVKIPSVELSSNSDSLSLYREFLKDIEIENLQLELDNLFIRLRYYNAFGLTYAQGIRATAIARLKSEDIEYLEYAGYLERSLKLQLEFLEVLNQYNQCAIQLEEYAY